MAFGAKTGSNVRNDLKNASGNGQYLQTLKDGKDMRVRFLQEPEDWYTYREHYSEATRFFPCTQDDTCPGCTSDSEKIQRSSKRYVASVLDTQSAKVVPLKMPIDLANRVTNKCDRNNGTLLDRDFTLIRTGKGMNDTTYDVEAEDKSQVDLNRYEIIDPEPLLEASFSETFGDGVAPVADTSTDAKLAEAQAELERLRAASKEAQFVAPKAHSKSEERRLAEMPAPKVVESGEVSVTPPTPPSTSTDDVITIESLNAMSGDELRKMCASNGLTPPAEAFDKESLLAWLLAEFGV